MAVKIRSMVMAISERARCADGLAEQLKCDVRYDHSRNGPWDNARGCWLSMAADDACTHAMLIQDDAILCSGFLDAVHRAVEARPLHVVNLWSCWPFLIDARVLGLSWVRSQSRCSGLALIMPRSWIVPFVDWRERYFDPAWTCCDGPLLLWRITHGDGFEYTAPSLVQHRADVMSAVNGRPNADQDRQSPWFAYRGADGVNWNTASLESKGRKLRYIAQCVPYLKDGIMWPPGGEPDPAFFAARHAPRVFGAHR